MEGGEDRLQPSLTPGTEAYFDVALSQIPEQEQELPTDKLLKMKLSQEELRNLCSKETLNTAFKMNTHGGLFIVEDSFDQKEKTLTWKIRSESYISTEIPVYSASRTMQYPVVIRYNEARTERVQKWDRVASCFCGCPWHEKVRPKYCKHIVYLIMRNFM